MSGKGASSQDEPAFDVRAVPRNSNGLLMTWLKMAELEGHYDDFRSLFNGKDSLEGLFSIDDRELEHIGLSDADKKKFFLLMVDTKFAEKTEDAEDDMWPQDYYNTDVIFDNEYKLKTSYIDSVLQHGRLNHKGRGRKGNTAFAHLGQLYIKDEASVNIAGRDRARNMEETEAQNEWRKSIVTELDERAFQRHGHNDLMSAMDETILNDLLKDNERIVMELDAVGYANPQTCSIGNIKIVLTENRTKGASDEDEEKHGHYSRNFTPFHRLIILVEAHSVQLDGHERKTMWDVLCCCRLSSSGEHAFRFHEHRETDVSFSVFNIENTMVDIKALAHHDTHLSHAWNDAWSKEYSYEVQVVDHAEGTRMQVYDSRSGDFDPLVGSRKNVSAHSVAGYVTGQEMHMASEQALGHRQLGGRGGDFGDHHYLGDYEGYQPKNKCGYCCRYFFCCKCLPCGRANEGHVDFEIYGSTKSKQLRELAITRFDDKQFEGTPLPSNTGAASPSGKGMATKEVMIHEYGQTSRYHSIEIIFANPVTNELELHTFLISHNHPFREIFRFCSLAHSHIPASTIPECSPGVQNRLRHAHMDATKPAPQTWSNQGSGCSIM